MIHGSYGTLGVLTLSPARASLVTRDGPGYRGAFVVEYRDSAFLLTPAR